MATSCYEKGNVASRKKRKKEKKSERWEFNG